MKKDQKEEVTLTANLQYMEYSSSYEIKVIVCGRELTHEEQLKKDIFYEIKCAQSDYNSDYVELPKEVDGEEVIYKKESLVIMQRQSFFVEYRWQYLPITMIKKRKTVMKKKK